MKTEMFKSAKAADLLKNYAAAANKHGLASADGDYSNANIQHDILAAIYRELRSRGLEEQQLILTLIDHPDEAVRGWAAAHSLEFAPVTAEPVLEALTHSSSIWGLNAEMTLKEWRKGKLTFP